MFHVSQIKEGMPVHANDEVSVGTVDYVEGLFIKLQQHCYLPIDCVSRIEGGVVHLRMDGLQAREEIAAMSPPAPTQKSA